MQLLLLIQQRVVENNKHSLYHIDYMCCVLLAASVKDMMIKSDATSSLPFSLATRPRPRFLVLLVVIVIVVTLSLKQRERNVLVEKAREDTFVQSKTYSSTRNATAVPKEVVVIIDDDAVPLFFIPNSPNETNLATLEESIIILNEEANDVDSSPFESCKPTAQVQILATTTGAGAGEEPLFWTLKTFDKDGQAKHVGGDELYVVYRDNAELHQVDPTAVALIHDNGDGSYRLDFVTTPMKPNLATGDNKQLVGVGNLIIYFDYTCDIGSLAPPSKACWNSKGSTSVVHTKTGVAQPPIRIFQPTAYPRPANLSSFPMINFIGASAMAHLVVNRVNKQKYQQPSNKTQMQNRIRSALTTKTANEFIQGIRHPETLNGSSSALIIGSDVWDILTNDPSHQGDPGFEDHLVACAHVVELARTLYPNTTVMWKSPTAMHILRLPSTCDSVRCNERVRYMSASRSRFLYTAQKELMQRLNVPFWDLYDMTYLSAFQTSEGDGRHYNAKFNKILSNYLFDT